ncbi:MAG: hypothetical protein ACOCP4_07445 [Candidatus Woesearchaeota archaeon]
MRVLQNNIDTIKIGFYADIDKDFIEKLAEKKELAADIDDPVFVEVAGLSFQVMPRGKARYSYVINIPGQYWIQIQPRQTGDYYPNIMVRIGSYACHNHDFYNLLRDDILGKFCEKIDNEKVSEVHLAVDVDDFEYDYDLHEHFVSCANKDTLYRQNRELRSAYIGSVKSDICLRVYNKTEEIVEKKKGYWLFENLREEYEIIGDVWRFEFQLKRKILKEFQVENFSSLIKKLGGIWTYLTDRRVSSAGEIMNGWVSFRNFGDENVSRRTIMSFWRKIINVSWFDSGMDLITRVRTGKIDGQQLVAQAVGCFTTFAASRCMKVSDLIFYIKQYFEKNRDEFEDKIIDKKCAFQL